MLLAGPTWEVRSGRLPDDVLSIADKRGMLVHIPKTGGISIAMALYGQEIGHHPWADLLAHYPRRFFRWFKFAIVRDPVDRFISAHDFLLSGSHPGTDKEFVARYVDPDINRFIEKLLGVGAFRREVFHGYHFRPQTSFVMLGSICMVNRLIAFERMADELPRLVGLPGVPRLNVTQGKRTGRDALTPQSLVTLRQIYARDFALHRVALGQ